MAKPERPIPNEPESLFGFVEDEVRFGAVIHDFFLEIIQSELTTIHEAKIASNEYGSFLFVTASRSKNQRQEVVTFWGLGLHNGYDKYVLETWRWYKPPLPIEMDNVVSPNEIETLVGGLQMAFRQVAEAHQQSDRGIIFQRLAEHVGEEVATQQMSSLDDILQSLLGE